ncbi:MAG TPA: hypothetical protein VIL63_02625, partial [Terriglobales bacterium]
LVQLPAVKMGRHGRAPGVQFAVKVRQFAACVFQEETARESEKCSGEVYKQHGDGEQYSRFVMMKK